MTMRELILSVKLRLVNDPYPLIKPRRGETVVQLHRNLYKGAMRQGLRWSFRKDGAGVRVKVV